MGQGLQRLFGSSDSWVAATLGLATGGVVRYDGRAVGRIMTDDVRNASWIAPAGAARTWLPRLAAVLGIALLLGACSKCDVPTWQRSSLDGAPAACHDERPAQ